MLYIDLKNAASSTENNFTCQLMRLLMKADISNFQKLSDVYPVEANMVWIYKNDCPYLDTNHTQVDFEEIERKAIDLIEQRKKDLEENWAE